MLIQRECLNEESDFDLEFELPISIEIEVTDKCNFNCSFCYNNSKNIRAFDDEDIFNKWFPFFDLVIKSGGVFQIIISGGEPLIYKEDIYKILKLISCDKTGLLLITNGYLLDEKFITNIKNMPWYWVQVSLDSYKKEVHDNLRGQIGAYDKVIKNVKLLKKYNIPVALSSVVTSNEVDNIENFILLALNLQVDAVLFSEIMPVGRARNIKKKGFDYEERKRYNENIRLCKEKYGNKILIQSASPYDKQISDMSKYIPLGFLVRPNGDVKLNCLTDDVIGNIFQENYLDVWKRICKEVE